MGHWALVKLAVSILPPGGWRDALIEHVERCPSCRTRLASRDEARGALVQAKDVGRRDELWPLVEHALGAEAVASGRPSTARAPAGLRRSYPWRWAAVAGGIALAAVIALFLPGDRLRRAAEPGFSAVPAADSLRILSANVGDRPAELYVVDVPEDRMILVWVEGQSKKGERS